MGMLARLGAAVVTGTLLVAGGPAAEAAPVTKPSPPRAVQAVPGDRAVTVRWTAPAKTGAAKVDRYAVQRRRGPSGSWQAAGVAKPTARSWTSTGLTNGTSYGFRVRVHTHDGWSRWSPAMSAVPRGLPGAPRYLEADPWADRLAVHWQAPPANGAPIDRYRVDFSTDGATWSRGVTWLTSGTPTSPAWLTGLTPGTRYYVRVHAHNSAGWGDDSQAGPYRVFTSPGAVTALEGVPGDGSVELKWKPPASNADAGVPEATGYRVEQSTDGVTWTEVATPAGSPYVVPGLTNGIAYRFRVSARAANGRLGWGPSTVVVPGAPYGPPGTVTGLTASTSPTAVTLSWVAPSGGGPVVAYDVQRSGDDGVFTAVASTTSTSFTDDAVTAGTSYTYRVVARNAHGSGGSSDLAVTTPVQALVLSTDTLTLTTGGSDSVGVSLAYRPTEDVIVTIAVDPAETATTGTATFTFTPDDWDVPQPVSVEGVAAGSATVTLSAAAVATRQVGVTVTDP